MGTVSADLTRSSLTAINGLRVVEIQEQTLRGGETLLATWTQLEPIVKRLIDKVRVYAESDAVDNVKAARLLSLCATVVQKLGAASTGVLKASEGHAKLALLLSAGEVKKKDPAVLTEKQMASLVIETVKRLKAEQGSCPICVETIDAHVQTPTT